MITIQVTLLVAKLASYAVLVLENKFFLSPVVKFSKLRTCYTSTKSKNTSGGKSKTSTTVANGGMVVLSGTRDKFPVFNVLN